MQKIAVALTALVVILVFLVWKFGPDFGNQTPTSSGPVNITYWDFWEEDAIKGIIADFEKTNPNIKVTYIKQSQVNYRTRVQTQIRANTGPNVFRVHNAWISMFEDDLTPAPTDVWSVSEYQINFYPVVMDSFVVDNKIFASPLHVDGLSLYYNEDILRAAGVTPPTSWQQFVDAAFKMTVRDSSGAIKTAGAAMGVPANVDHWSDILGLLILQRSGANPATPVSPEMAEILSFFTGFIIDPGKKTWDVTLPSSSTMFAQGNLAFYFGPSWRALQFQQINPNLKFKVAPVPQLPGVKIAWANFWGLGVSATTKDSKESWQFVRYLTLGPAVKTLGSPYAKVDLAPESISDPFLGAYIAQGPYYKFWYLASGTQDLGLNDEMIGVWTGVVNEVLAGKDVLSSLQLNEPKIREVLNKYIRSPSSSNK